MTRILNAYLSQILVNSFHLSVGCLLTCHGLPPLALHLSPTSWGLVDHLLSQTLVRHHAWHVRHPTLLQGQRHTTVSESSIYYKVIHSNS